MKIVELLEDTEYTPAYTSLKDISNITYLFMTGRGSVYALHNGNQTTRDRSGKDHFSTGTGRQMTSMKSYFLKNEVEPYKLQSAGTPKSTIIDFDDSTIERFGVYDYATGTVSKESWDITSHMNMHGGNWCAAQAIESFRKIPKGAILYHSKFGDMGAPKLYKTAPFVGGWVIEKFTNGKYHKSSPITEVISNPTDIKTALGQ